MKLETALRPTRSWGISALWALPIGIVLQWTIPLLFEFLGCKGCVLASIYPGLLPIIWATRGWFAGISPAGYVVMRSVNTLFYAALVFSGLRLCRFLTDLYER
jgi:hypothetical protein